MFLFDKNVVIDAIANEKENLNTENKRTTPIDNTVTYLNSYLSIYSMNIYLKNENKNNKYVGENVYLFSLRRIVYSFF